MNKKFWTVIGLLVLVTLSVFSVGAQDIPTPTPQSQVLMSCDAATPENPWAFVNSVLVYCDPVVDQGGGGEGALAVIPDQLDIQQASWPTVLFAVRGGTPVSFKLTETAQLVGWCANVIKDGAPYAMLADGVGSNAAGARVTSPLVLEPGDYTVTSACRSGGFRVIRGLLDVAEGQGGGAALIAPCQGEACWFVDTGDVNNTLDDFLIWTGLNDGMQDVETAVAPLATASIRGGMKSQFLMGMPFSLEICVGKISRVDVVNNQEVLSEVTTIDGCPQGAWDVFPIRFPAGMYIVENSVGDQGGYRATPLPNFGWRKDQTPVADLNRFQSGSEYYLDGQWFPMPTLPIAGQGGADAALQGTVSSDTGTLAFNEKPDANSAMLLKNGVPNNTTVTVLGRDPGGDWLAVSYNNQVGWMYALAVKVDDVTDVMELPVYNG